MTARSTLLITNNTTKIMTRRVVITGMGVISPLANNVNDFWKGLVEGQCAIDYIQQIPNENLPVRIAAEVKNFDPTAYGIDKSSIRHSDTFALYAMAAATQAMQDAGLEVEGTGANAIAADRIGVCIGSGVGGIQTFQKQHAVLMNDGSRRVSPLFIPMMIGNMGAANVATVFHAEGPCLPVVTACATGTHSIGEAFLTIAYGRADAMIAGGTEAAVTEIAIAGFNNCKALTHIEDPKHASIPFDANRSGFVLGEGSGVMILEEYEHAVRRGANILAEVVGYGNTCDAYHYTAPRPDAKCSSKAIAEALRMAKYTAEDHLYINAHGTSTPLNDKSETLAIKMALGETDARRALISSNKSMIGHMLGAAGAVELIASVMTLCKGIVPPTIGLTTPDPDCDLDYVPGTARQANVNVAISNSFGFGGQNACVAIRKM